MNSKKEIVIVLICASLVASSIITTQTVRATIDVYPGPGTPIQDAINTAPYDATIYVHAGTYNEQIHLWWNVTIIGDGVATTIIDGTGLAGGTPVVTLDCPGDLSFSGFTITGAPPDGDGESFGMVAEQSHWPSYPTGITYTISDCKFVGTNTPANNGEFQFYASGGEEAIVFTRNLITQYSGNAIVSEIHTGPTEISYSSFDAPLCNVNPADTIFFMTYGGNDVNTLQNISYNTFNMDTANLKVTAVSINAPGPSTAVGNAQYTNVVITGNMFNDFQANGRAIQFRNGGGDGSQPAANNIISPVVTKNSINGVGELAGTYGIAFYDDNGNTIGATISSNTIQGMDVGIYLRAGDAPETTIRNNNITGNTVGVDWTLGLTSVDAVGNWWGSATGPNPPGTGDMVTGNVNYSPFLTAPAKRVPSLYVDPTQVNRAPEDVGTDFTVAVTLFNFTDLKGFDVSMTWNSSLITFVSADYTTALNTLWGTGNWSIALTEPGTGYYFLGAYSTNATANNTGASILFNLTFQVAMSWESSLSTAIHFDLVKLSDATTPTPNPILAEATDGTYTMSAMAPGLEFKVEKRNKWTGANVTIDPPYHFEARDYFHVNVYVTNVGALTNYSLRIEFTTGFVEFQGVEYWGIFGLGDVSYTPGASVIEVNGSGSAWSGSEGLLCKLTFYVNFTVVPEHIWKYGSSNYATLPISITDATLGFGSMGIISMSGITPPSALSIEVDFIRGDVDCNGAVNMADISNVAYYYNQAVSPAPAQYDLNNDNFIDIYDIVTIATNYLYGTHP
jgi:hypothetical protein